MKIYDVWAEWCPPCTRFAPIFKSVSEKFPEHEFIKVNAEEDGTFLWYWKINSIPTILFVDENENEVYRHTGILPEHVFEDIVSRVAAALE